MAEVVEKRKPVRDEEDEATISQKKLLLLENRTKRIVDEWGVYLDEDLSFEFEELIKAGKVSFWSQDCVNGILDKFAVPFFCFAVTDESAWCLEEHCQIEKDVAVAFIDFQLKKHTVGSIALQLAKTCGRELKRTDDDAARYIMNYIEKKLHEFQDASKVVPL